jgi:hypothetical protein
MNGRARTHAAVGASSAAGWMLEKGTLPGSSPNNEDIAFAICK